MFVVNLKNNKIINEINCYYYMKFKNEIFLMVFFINIFVRVYWGLNI